MRLRTQPPLLTYLLTSFRLFPNGGLKVSTEMELSSTATLMTSGS